MNPRCLLFLVVLLSLSSCSVFLPGMKTGILDMRIETLQNGHLVHIRVDRPIGTVSALVTQGHWLVVTIEDSLLDANNLNSFRSKLVDTVEVTHFPTALQLAFHLTTDVNAIEVIHTNPSQDVLLSLFTERKREGKRTK